MGWKTILGIIVAAVGWAGSAEGVSILPEAVANGAQTLGTLFAMF